MTEACRELGAVNGTHFQVLLRRIGIGSLTATNVRKRSNGKRYRSKENGNLLQGLQMEDRRAFATSRGQRYAPTWKIRHNLPNGVLYCC